MKQQVRVRSATTADAPVVFEMIRLLSSYERLDHEVVGNVDAVKRDLEAGAFTALIAERGEEPVGFALFFETYSTFCTARCLHLEDLFVVEEARGCGAGKALLSAVAAEAVRRECPRLQWNVLDWNQPAIDFYESVGAVVMEDWKTCRLKGEALAGLAAGDG